MVNMVNAYDYEKLKAEYDILKNKYNNLVIVTQAQTECINSLAKSINTTREQILETQEQKHVNATNNQIIIEEYLGDKYSILESCTLDNNEPIDIRKINIDGKNILQVKMSVTFGFTTSIFHYGRWTDIISDDIWLNVATANASIL